MLLNLTAVRHSTIGAPGEGGVSMECRKKLTIGVELISEPAMLFLDEPTTGLDSNSAASVMRAVRGVAAGISVLCTIHQPPDELVQFFQDVLLLEEGGRVVFFGAVHDMPIFLAEQPGIPPMSPGRNVSDYALEAVSSRARLLRTTRAEDTAQELPSPGVVNAQAERADSVDVEQATSLPGERVPKGLSEAFLTSHHYTTIQAYLSEGRAPTEVASPQVMTPVQLRAGFWLQLRLLTERFARSGWRNKASLQVRYLFAVIFGFVVGTVFYKEGLTQQSGPQRLSVLFFTVGHFMFSSSSFFPDIFTARPIYFRETINRLYTPLPYFIARFLGDQPHIFLETLISTIMIYFLAALNPEHHSSHYGYFLWACWLVRVTSVLLTQLVASVIASPDFAYSILSTIFYVMFALTGFFIPNGQIPSWWDWLADLDFLRYVLQFLAIEEYEDEVFSCDPRTDVLVVRAMLATQDSCAGLNVQTFPNPSDTTGSTILRCQYACGDELLDSLGVVHTSQWKIQSFAIAHCWAVFFFLCGYFALRFINHISR